jgi:hypothetical protein
LEGLCTTEDREDSDAAWWNTWNHNTSTPSANDTPGMLWWTLQGPGGIFYPSAMILATFYDEKGANPNMKVATFTMDASPFTPVSFAESGAMYIQLGPDKVESWYMCWTSWSTERLAWRLGNGEPRDLSCQKVRVQQVFV